MILVGSLPAAMQWCRSQDCSRKNRGKVAIARGVPAERLFLQRSLPFSLKGMAVISLSLLRHFDPRRETAARAQDDDKNKEERMK